MDRSEEPTAQHPAVAAEGQPAAPASPCVVCLGASAGGLEALQEFFACLPTDTGAAYVVILHLSPDFKSLMPELLARHTGVPIHTATHATRLEGDTIYIIPPGKNMVVRDGQLLLHDQDRAPGHPLHLPIDIFLRSLAEQSASQTVGVIFSGTGSDGSRGIRALKDAGGVVLVQSLESARFDGMPRSALDSGAADAAGSPSELAAQVAQIVRFGAGARALGEDGDEEAPEGEARAVLDVLRARLHMDLGYLRPRMLMRRVRRRMALLGIEGLADYVEHLSTDADEARLLRKDLFIGVTGFFRDRQAFELLHRHLVHGALAREPDQPFRVWVPACASGEEAYSLLIVLLEAMEACGVRRPIKMFATDIDAESLALASRGAYPSSGVAELGPGRVARYFTHEGDTVSVQPTLREMVICAQHNLVCDPPFTRLDLVSCRNFLIYLEPERQEQVLASLHFALKPNGTLFLGSAEALGNLEGEFETIDSKHRLYRKARNVVLPSMRRRAGRQDPLTLLARGTATSRAAERDVALRQVLDSLVEGDGGSAALISMEGQLVEVLGDALGVFRLPKGRPTSDVARLVSRPISAALTTALQRLRRGEPELRCPVGLEDAERGATLRLKRLPATATLPERVLVLVEPAPVQGTPGEGRASTEAQGSTLHVEELQLELQQTRESLQATIEELQSSNEEQQSTNEELIASNEELQSTNEELQSVNEELFTVNVEHQNKIQELAVLAADLDNLLKAIDVGTLFLDDELRIRKFTPSIDRIVRLMEHDVGRSFLDFTHELGRDFADELRRVLETGQPTEREVRGPKGTWLLVRALPYTSHSGQTNGIVVTVIDVTITRNAREMTRLVNEQLAHANRQLSIQREELEDLFSIVAHDLKRPVIALDGLVQLAIEDLADESGPSDADEGAAALLPRAREECARMRRMLEDLGHVSGLARRAVKIEDVELQPWLDGLVARVRKEADERGVRIHCASDAETVSIPRAALDEGATNLLENALKYGCTNPDPRIDVSCIVREGFLELTIGDNGKGIAPEDQQKVFEPFRRLDPELAPGSGLGLVAVRRVLTQHGGTVRLDSEPGRGSKFVLRLPIDPESDASWSRGARKPKVLLVEDDALDSKLIQRLLGDTVACTSVKMLSDAEAQLRRELFDLVLLDLSLPDGHGLELVHRMRDLIGTPIPVVVVTGHGEGLSPASLSETISGYVAKSEMGKEALTAAVRRALEQERNG